MAAMPTCDGYDRNDEDDSATWAEAMASINADYVTDKTTDTESMERPRKKSFMACRGCRTKWDEGRRQAMHAKCVQCLVSA